MLRSLLLWLPRILRCWQRWRLCSSRRLLLPAVLERMLARSFAVVLEVLLVQVLALTTALVQALGPVVLMSRKLWVQMLAPGCQVQLPGMVLVQVLALAATLVHALGPGSSRRGE